MTKAVKHTRARDRLTREFGAMFEQTQAPGAATAMHMAFDTPTRTLGEIAAAAAMVAKTKRRPLGQGPAARAAERGSGLTRAAIGGVQALRA